MDQTGIAYQNKDITSKYLAENFRGKTFSVYGLDLPEVRQVLPTNIPTVKANELRLDNLFELADGSIALVDYESDYEKQDKVKYLNYVTGIANRYLRDKKDCPIIHMIVIYTGDIDRQQVEAEYDIGAVKMSLETAFLSELDSESIYIQLRNKVEKNQMLNDEELMEFIILPLSYRTKEEKQKKVRETVELAVKIQDKKQQIFTLAGILVFADKVIDRETAGRIRRAIEMTQVAQIFEEEKQQALLQVTQIFEEEKQQALLQVTQIFEEEKQQALLQAAKDKQQSIQDIAVRMIKQGYSTDEIRNLIPIYSHNDIEQLREKIARNDN